MSPASKKLHGYLYLPEEDCLDTSVTFFKESAWIYSLTSRKLPGYLPYQGGYTSLVLLGTQSLQKLYIQMFS